MYKRQDQYAGDRSFLFIEYCFHSSESFGLLQAVSLVFVVVEVVLRVGDLRVGNGVVAVARFDPAVSRVELQIGVVAVVRYGFVPDAPADQVVLALEFAEKLAGALVADLLLEARGGAEGVLGQIGARAGHVEVLDRLLVVFFVEVALGHHQQRVGIARALVTDPDIIFADEPTGNLDSKTSDDVMRSMCDTVKSHGKTFIMVTHDPNMAAYADKVINILDGRITDIYFNRHETVGDKAEISEEIKKEA